ncbi:MAG TPA: ABC transporter ATP-binding protein [Hanamia sp.]|nr:ABC transporter ATP-binding protein [Hanamia sp.]
MSVVIKVENLSKQYRLGNVGTGSLAHDLNRTWHRIRGKEDPYLKIGEENDRTTKGLSDYIWALRDINFEVQQGEILGIIGKNGAGKSTLLKILSRTTSPTTGQIKIRGRVASLLEVGTGFHPELTGRENIFLNGSILGMHKQEIRQKFDEIVDFSGVQRYIDTPVKRYSSGMYVRLAFAVAAHLEPEILIVDEVLAVGDAEFQRKALGKMKDVSNKDGRTVLFVSHNMEAILNLCSQSILLRNGTISQIGSTSSIIDKYLIVNHIQEEKIDLTVHKRNSGLKQNIVFKSVALVNDHSLSWQIKYKQPLIFKFEIEIIKEVDEFEIGIALFTTNDFEIVSSLSSDFTILKSLKPGIHSINYSFEDFNLLPNNYKVGLGIRSEKGSEDYIPLACHFEITISEQSANDKSNTRKGVLIPKNKIFFN